MILENGAYYAHLAPDYFKQPDEEGLADFIEGDSEWRNVPTNPCLIAEIEMDTWPVRSRRPSAADGYGAVADAERR